MEKYAWKATIVERQIEEYKRRHDNLWDEMKDILVMEMDPETGAQPLLRQVFSFN